MTASADQLFDRIVLHPRGRAQTGRARGEQRDGARVLAHRARDRRARAGWRSPRGLRREGDRTTCRGVSPGAWARAFRQRIFATSGHSSRPTRRGCRRFATCQVANSQRRPDSKALAPAGLVPLSGAHERRTERLSVSSTRSKQKKGGGRSLTWNARFTRTCSRACSRAATRQGFWT